MASCHNSAGRRGRSRSLPGSTNSEQPAISATTSSVRWRSHHAASSGGATRLVIVGASQPAIASPIAITIERSPRENGRRSATSVRGSGWPRRIPSMSATTATRPTIITSPIGTPIAIHSTNDRSSPRWRSSASPNPFGGVPTGVPSPPTDAAHATTSTSAVANRSPRSRGAIASAIGSRIAVAAVFDISIDSTNAAAAIAIRNDSRPRA